MKKPIDARKHGIIDYAFTGIQVLGPLGINGNAKKTYQALSLGLGAIDALTDTPVGVRPTIVFRDHRKAETSFLLGFRC
ncbi:MAG TPA: hypothetical protein VNQ55_05775 [Parapedobacter sp.]|nr:hypothetical protein [Parapedobacter sp.]